MYYIKETLDKKNIKKSAKRLPFFLLAFCEKGKNSLLMVFSLLSFSLSNFFFTLVFRVSYKTLKLGEVKISSVLLFSIQAAKKQGVSTFSLKFLNSNTEEE